MPDTIIVALITGACAVIAQLIISYNTNQRMLSELEKRSEISDVKIEGQIDRKKGTVGFAVPGEGEEAASA